MLGEFFAYVNILLYIDVSAPFFLSPDLQLGSRLRAVAHACIPSDKILDAEVGARDVAASLRAIQSPEASVEDVPQRPVDIAALHIAAWGYPHVVNPCAAKGPAKVRKAVSRQETIKQGIDGRGAFSEQRGVMVGRDAVQLQKLSTLLRTIAGT